MVGTVGGEETPEGAHIEFQIRSPGGEVLTLPPVTAPLTPSR